MKFRLLRLGTVFVLLWVSLSYGQTGWIEGNITNAETGKAIPGVVVEIEGIGSVALSDKSGQFRIKGIPEGVYTLRLSFVGYRERMLENVSVKVGEITKLSVSLKQEAIEMDEIVGEAKREVLPAEEKVPAFVTVIPLEAFEGKSESLPDVLSKSAGIQIKQLGGLGSFSTISIRGSSSDQVDVYLDGVLLNQALGGGVNLGNLPLSNVERIEVYKATSSSEFGGSNIGGVVNIRTKSAERGIPSTFTLSLGSFNTQTFSWLSSQRIRALDYLVSFDYARSDNDFEFLDDNGTLYNPEDDESARRANNYFRSVNLLGKLGRRFARGYTFHLNNNFYRKKQGLPGISNNQSRATNLMVLRNLSELKWTYPQWAGGRLKVEQGMFYTYRIEEYKDLKGEMGVGREDTHNVIRTFGLRSTAKILAGRHQLFQVSLLWSGERYKPWDELRRKSSFFESKRERRSLGIEDEIFLWNDRVSIVPAFRYDHYSSEFFGENPFLLSASAPKRTDVDNFYNRRMGVRVGVTDWLTLKGNIGRYLRVPSFYELFGDKGAVMGNTDLRPEEGLNRDIGFRIRTARRSFVDGFTWEVAYYHNKQKNLIHFFQNTQRVSIPHNIGLARISGVEINGETGLAELLRLKTNYTYQEAIDDSKISYYRGNLLPNRPKHEFFGKVELVLRAVTLFYEHNLQSENFLDKANQKRADPRTVINLGVTLFWKTRLKVTVEVKNLTDSQIVDLWSYPLPGRSYFFTLNGKI